MTVVEFDPEPSADTLADEQAEWQQTQDTRTRLRTVITGLREPAAASTIAERARCSPTAARKHLNEFVELGIVRQSDAETSGTQYVRNEAYFSWHQANELATTYTIEQLLEALKELETHDEQYREEFAAATPADVALPDDATHAELEARLRTLSEWHSIRESIDRHKEALRIARREDSQLPA